MKNKSTVSAVADSIEILSNERERLGIPRDAGFIYVLYNPVSNLVKIGASKNPMSRTRNISSISGFPYEQARVWISPKIGNHYDMEHSLHRYFDNYRKNGEWFAVDFDTVVEYAKIVCTPISKETLILMKETSEKEGKRFLEGMKQLMSNLTQIEQERALQKQLEDAEVKKIALQYVRHLCNDVLKLENNMTTEVMDRTFVDLYGEDEKTKVSPLSLAGHHTSLRGKPLDFSVHCHLSNMWFSCSEDPLPSPWGDGLCFLLNCWEISGYAPIIVPIWSYVDEETNLAGWRLDEDFHCSFAEKHSVDYFIRKASAWMWVTNMD